MTRPSSVVVGFVLAVLCSGCGYRSVHRGDGGASGSGQRERFSVVLTTSNIPDAVAIDEVVAGVRDELARSGALRSGESYPRCEIEVLRSDESSEGIDTSANPEGVLIPEARATRVGIVARAWIQRTKDSPRERDTGDVRAMEVAASAADARTATFRHADALRAASRRVGRRVGARILGMPTSTD